MKEADTLTQSDAEIWQHWLQWLPAAPPIDRPAPIFAQYRATLHAAGVSAAEVDARLGVVLRLMRTQSDGWQALFNNIYASPTPGFNTQPNALLASAVAGRTPGRALDVSAGQGRNAVFLAIQGWAVTALDVSNEGLRIAAHQAQRAGVPLHTVCQSHDTFDFGTATWDLIVLTYAPVPLTAPAYAERIRHALRPAGLLLVESFASDATAQGRRPVDIDPAELQRAYAELRTLHFADEIALPDWEPQETRLLRFVAEKGLDSA